ncbi:uncharacterized protein [Miscanthus floridulus]|uniref:uncharacterized protein n=1 Tax=Miscanthus floridulus TaxID=154761 RepID=UPI00345B0C6A
MSNQENVDIENNMASHSTDANTHNEIGENSDRLHRQSTYSNGFQQLSDGMEPLSCIGGTDDVHDIDSEQDISTTHEMDYGYAPSPINRLVTCPKERKHDRDRARKVAMSLEERALLNKRRHELYAQKKASKKSVKMLQMTPKEISLSTDDHIPLIIGGNKESPPPSDIDNSLAETDINTIHETGTSL